MSYPQGAPGGPGYRPAHQPNAYFGAPTEQFAKLPDFDGTGGSKLPAYLASAIVALGLLLYLASFGPQLSAGTDFFITPFRIDFAVAASLSAALIAGVGLLPKQTPRPAPVAVLSVLCLLLVIWTMLTAPRAVTVEWGMYLVAAVSAIQAIVGVGALLLDAGVVAAPVPRPRYEQPQYGQPYPGGYYGQAPGQPAHGGPTYPQQRPGYPSPYGGSGYPGAGPSTGGFSAVGPSGPAGQAGHAEESGPPTPPTGFPAYGQPPSDTAPTAQAPTRQEPEPSAQGDAQGDRPSAQSDRSS